MFATTFQQVSHGYELCVDQQHEEPTVKWLNVQECIFEKNPQQGYVRFLITSAPTGAMLRLNQKFNAANDNDSLQKSVDILRDALRQKSWEQILSVTQEWTQDFKKQTWMLLTEDEKKEICFLSIKHSEKQDFEERLYAIDQKIVKKMVILLKEVGLIDKGFKVANKTTKDFIAVIVSDFLKNEEFVRASLQLACACAEE